MTVSTTTNRNEYTGNGVNDTFAYTCRIFANTDLKVYVDSVLQTITTHYTVTGVDEPSGGNVVFEAGSIPANGTSVVIYREVPHTQSTDYVGGEKFSAETHEKALDRLTCIVQQLQDDMDRCIKLAKTVTDAGTTEVDETATSRANKLLGFDNSGDLVIDEDLGEWQGTWATSTAYVVGDTVSDGAAGANTGNLYRCIVAHTSGTWATDLAASKWSVMLNVQSLLTTEFLILDPALGTNQTVNGYVAEMTAGETLAFGEVCYLKSDGKWWKADADAASTMPGLAMCADASIAADADGNFLMWGFARDDAWSWGTKGGMLYVDTTAGDFNQTAPSGSGDQVQVAGIAYTATVIFFNPSPVLVEIA